MADYPNTIPSLPSNMGGKTSSKTGLPTGGDVGYHSGLHRQLARELAAALVELGTNPSGSYATVKARLDAIVAGEGGGSTEGQINVADFGAEPGFLVSDAAITSGDNELSSAQAAFVAGDIGKQVLIQRAGAGLPAPTGLAAVAVGAAGIFGGAGGAAAGTYYYKIACGVSDESLPSSEVSVAVVANEAVDLTWDEVPGLAELNGYYIVRRATVAGTYSGFVGVVRAVDAAGAPLLTLRDTGRPQYSSGGFALADATHDDLEAEIVDVVGGNAILDADASNTRSGAWAWVGKDVWDALQRAVGENQGKEIVIANPDLPSRGVGTSRFYLSRRTTDLSQQTGTRIRGLGNPRITNISRDDPVLDMLSTIKCSAKDITIGSANRWAGRDAGIVCDFSEYPIITHLDGAIDATQMTLTIDEALPDYWFPTDTAEIGVFVSWNYDPMASPQVEPIAEGMFVRPDLDADPTGKTWTISQRNRYGTIAASHLDGANIVARNGQWDCNEVDLDFSFESEVYQPSLGSGCRLNRIISSRVKMNCNGVGGGFPACGLHAPFKGGQYTGYLVIGQNSRRYRYGQAGAYANIVRLNECQFRRGGNCFVLIMSTDCENLTIEGATFEHLTFSHPGAILGGAGNQLYTPVLKESWFGDAGGSGSGWLWNLSTLGQGHIADCNFFTVGGGDANSGYVAFLKGGWKWEGGRISAPNATYAAVIYTPAPDQLYLTLDPIPGMTDGTAPWTAPYNLDPRNLVIGAASASGPYEQGSGPVIQKGQRVQTQTSNFSVAPSDIGSLILVDSASAVDATLQTGTSYLEGSGFDLAQQGAGQVTVNPAGGVTLVAPNGAKTAAQGSVLKVQRIATNTWLVSGDATT